MLPKLDQWVNVLFLYLLPSLPWWCELEKCSGSGCSQILEKKEVNHASRCQLGASETQLFPRVFLLKVWSMDEQCSCHLFASTKWMVSSGPAAGLQNQKLLFTRSLS